MDLSTRYWETTLEAAIANTLASSTAMASHLNSERKRIYLQNFESWKVMVLAGKIDNLNPPQPPMAYEVVKVEKGEPGDVGFSYPALGKSPVCEMPEVPADYSKPVVQVIPEPDHIRQAPAGDTVAIGTVITDANGVKWQKQRSVTPFGVAYFYVRVS